MLSPGACLSNFWVLGIEGLPYIVSLVPGVMLIHICLDLNILDNRGIQARFTAFAHVGVELGILVLVEGSLILYYHVLGTKK